MSDLVRTRIVGVLMHKLIYVRKNRVCIYITMFFPIYILEKKKTVCILNNAHLLCYMYENLE